MEIDKLTKLAINAITTAGQSDTSLIKRGYAVNARVMLTVGQAQWLLSINQGKLIEISAAPFVMPSITFEIAAPEDEWHRFWNPVPPPGSHDLFALLKRRVLTLNGNLHPLMSNLFYFKFLLAAPRRKFP